MNNGTPPDDREFDVLPPAITHLYPGKCIIYSEDEQRVIGVGDTWEEAADQAEASGVKGLWHFGFAEYADVSDF
ncbi:MAG: hypothetical protein K2R98_04515 [Gemmataceae bacterium]|nr:hypothetical protein [Gemmataceae bacterium]